MARPRKRHVQLALEIPTWGGKRAGAGRPRAKGPRRHDHGKRPQFEQLSVAHVTLRLVHRFPSLRKRDMWQAIRAATRAVLHRTDFRIVQLSIEKDHVHLVVEAAHERALARGVQAFEISAAQHLNRAVTKRTGERRRGRVFADRYHARLLRTPTETRNVLKYVLNNWRHPDEDDGWDVDIRFWDIDYFSSGLGFDGWAELPGHRFRHHIPPEDRLAMSEPRSWLLRGGWQRGGGPISMYAVPGARHRAVAGSRIRSARRRTISVDPSCPS